MDLRHAGLKCPCTKPQNNNKILNYERKKKRHAGEVGGIDRIYDKLD